MGLADGGWEGLAPHEGLGHGRCGLGLGRIEHVEALVEQEHLVGDGHLALEGVECGPDGLGVEAVGGSLDALLERGHLVLDLADLGAGLGRILVGEPLAQPALEAQGELEADEGEHQAGQDDGQHGHGRPGRQTRATAPRGRSLGSPAQSQEITLDD